MKFDVCICSEDFASGECFCQKFNGGPELSLVKRVCHLSSLKRVARYLTQKPNYQVYFVVFAHWDTYALKVCRLIRAVDKFAVISLVTTQPVNAMAIIQSRVYPLNTYSIGDSDLNRRIVTDLKASLRLPMIGSSQKNGGWFFVENKSISLQLPLLDVNYFQTADEPHKIDVVTNFSKRTVTAKLSEIVVANPSFIRVHRSFVVNVPNIEVMDRSLQMLMMNNGDQIPVARRMLAEVGRRIRSFNAGEGGVIGVQ
ncbi:MULTISPECIES: LytTR family DNA-binding domain-containing protein [Lactiplantibacillus]|uniref:LytTR family transcriptional regulator DNA-binding domain-containing protein n=1 Tax=Lactiplantibacillus pentosus TaxID=1589 RepID=A0AAW8WD30_LACPE|nr:MULTISPECIES: LytTR family transcriptional regulator DNA-binding domain-containing protein [Lactiplantibacillus]MBU7461343.1 LytTR family transcriptional regulator DNA-binding domain-containing protein [Lactiplantibacillus pentosus]MBU7476936.1 LytTR family transcriptional regulator DNA-binding domain-containing protein [Lactiplantibacillus pentosus]MBU7483966.1 LytTR family transcriptional regulator DNA-binding domain-containing protein [Lactiplantibacillus sp. 30.2.29]MBU7487183.1 LytTR fa